jgi:hypothetical protein
VACDSAGGVGGNRVMEPDMSGHGLPLVPLQRGRSITTRIGSIAVLAFVAECYRRDLLVSLPTYDVGYDLIVHNTRSNEMWRVQIKTASQNTRGRWIGSLRMDSKRPRRYEDKNLVQRFVFARPKAP